MKFLKPGVVSLVACLSFAAAARAEDTIKIAYIDPLSGLMAATGDHGLHEFQYVADQINAKGGVLGKKIEIVPLDNKLSPQESLQVFSRVTDEGIGQNIEMRIFKSTEQPLGHLRRRLVHMRVDACDHQVELSQNFVVQIEGPILPDVHLAGGKDADAVQFLVQFADLADLRQHALLIHPVGHGQGFRMIRQSDVLQAAFLSGLRHFPD